VENGVDKDEGEDVGDNEKVVVPLPLVHSLLLYVNRVTSQLSITMYFSTFVAYRKLDRKE